MTSLNEIELTLTSSGLTTATTAYTALDILGAELSGSLGGSVTKGLITGATLQDKSDITGAIAVYVGDRAFSLGSDNAASSISDANSLFLTPTFYFPTPDDLGGVRHASIDSAGIPVSANASQTVYFRLVTLTAHTFFGAATDLQMKVYIVTDA